MSSTTTPASVSRHIHPQWEGTRVRGWSKVKLLSCGNSVWHSLISWIFHILLQTLKRVCPGAGPACAVFTTRVSGISIFGFKTDQQPKGQSGEWVGSYTFLFLLKSAGCTWCRDRLSKTRMPTTDGRASLSLQTSCGSANSGNAWELLKKKKKRASWGRTTGVCWLQQPQCSSVLWCKAVEPWPWLQHAGMKGNQKQRETAAASVSLLLFPPPWVNYQWANVWSCWSDFNIFLKNTSGLLIPVEIYY